MKFKGLIIVSLLTLVFHSQAKADLDTKGVRAECDSKNGLFTLTAVHNEPPGETSPTTMVSLGYDYNAGQVQDIKGTCTLGSTRIDFTVGYEEPRGGYCGADLPAAVMIRLNGKPVKLSTNTFDNTCISGLTGIDKLVVTKQGEIKLTTSTL